MQVVDISNILQNIILLGANIKDIQTSQAELKAGAKKSIQIIKTDK